MEITVRRAEPKDAERLDVLLVGIAKLHHDGRPDLFTDSGSKYTIKDLEKKMKSKKEVILVAVDENDYVLGYAMSVIKDRAVNAARKSFKTLYLDDLCVDAEARSGGIGRKLMDASMKTAKDLGCYNFELHVWSFNENARTFYEKCGLTEQQRTMEMIL